MNARFSTLLLASLLWTSTALAQITETKLVSGEGILFGQAVAVAGDRAVVGGGLLEGNAAYSYRRIGDAWVEQGMLVPADGTDAEGFGSSVAMTEAYAIVGAPLFDHGGATNGGASYLFERDGDSWAEQTRVAPSDVDGQDDSGTSVAVSGDYAIVGAPKHNGIGFDSGAAYIFERVGESWIQQAKLVASDEAANDEFGIAVSISGDYAIVGAWRDDDTAAGSGSAYVFKRTDDVWIEQTKLTVSDGGAGASFGFAVGLSGDYALVGSTLADGGAALTGAAYVFKRDGDDWVLQDKLAAEDGVPSDFFGVSVAIDDEFAVIGSFNADGSSPGTGAAYVFNRQGSTWTQIAKLAASDGGAVDLFGGAVAISDDCALVGAEGSNTARGAAYAYCGFAALVSTQDGVPDSLHLASIYPNPTTSTATVGFTLPTAEEARVEVFDLLGRRATTLADGFRAAGEHRVTLDATRLPSGVYVVRLSTPTTSLAERVTVAR
ncbi:MAG: T9SS type A sorting domain-containing protein [Bacteroidota bacterium]